MSGVISLVISAGQYGIAVWLPTIELLKNFPGPKTWAVFGIVCIFLSSYLAWKDERKKVLQLRSELASERSNLSGCPQIVLRHDEHDAISRFQVLNSGSCDAISVTIDQQESDAFILTGETIHYIKAGDKAPLILQVAQKRSEDIKEGFEAWKAFAGDKWGHAFPSAQGRSKIEQLNEVAVQLTTYQLVIPVSLWTCPHF